MTIYYTDSDVTIREITETDPSVFCSEEIAQGWVHATEDKYRQRLADQASGKATSLVADYDGHPAGYLSVYMGAAQDPATGQPCCELVDFGVLQKYQRRGIGSRLMEVAETIAAQYADTVCLSVGLHSSYGSAQRMYVKRGYIPDGRGVLYGTEPCHPYESYPNDDDLVLCLSKKLR